MYGDVYNPSDETAAILDRALGYVRSVPYQVTARWVFYRLLQDGTFDKKSDYKRLLGYLSNARKRFYGGWRPDTLGDDTRAALVRGSGHASEADWLDAVKRNGVICNLDRWHGQRNYVEVWFEAAAMQGQFQFYVNENVPLLAFHGDVSIPAKWEATQRLIDRWNELQEYVDEGMGIVVLYYGDYDPKGLQIPVSAENDVRDFGEGRAGFEFSDAFEFIRVGINRDDITDYNIPENPERPGTYQWEGIDDDAAQDLISRVNDYIDEDLFEDRKQREAEAEDKLREHLSHLDFDTDPEPDDA